MGADRSSRATLTGVLLHHHDPGTRSGNPTLDDRRALDAQRCFTTQTVKDVPRQNGNDVVGLDKQRAKIDCIRTKAPTNTPEYLSVEDQEVWRKKEPSYDYCRL